MKHLTMGSSQIIFWLKQKQKSEKMIKMFQENLILSR